MAFTDDFNGPANQALSARTGWTLAFGTDCYKVNAAGTKLTKTVLGSALDVYFRDDDGATSQSVKGDLGAGQAGLLVFASGTSSANFNAYYMRATSSTNVRLYQYDNGVVSAALLNLTVTDLIELELRVSLNGSSQPVLQIYSHGSPAGSSYTDTSASKKTSGRRGVASTATGTITDWLDNYVDDYSASPFTITERPSGFVFEGRRQSSSISYTVAWSSNITTLEARLEDGAGNAAGGTSWATKIGSPGAAPSSGVVTFTGIPEGGPYYLSVRNSADPTNSKKVAGNLFYVGGVILLWGQSQCSRLGTVNLGGATPTSGLKATYCLHSTGAPGGSVGFIDVLSNYATIGSAIVGICNQWHADTGGVPLMILHSAAPGTGIDQWISDLTVNGWGLWTGLGDAYLDACERQASAVVYMQGTNNVGNHGAYAAWMDTFQSMWLGQLTGQDPLFIVIPHHRTNDGAQTWNMRNVQYAKAISGGRWRLGCWLLDWEMDGDTSPHQSATAAGNRRAGPRIGRGLAKNLYDTALDIGGPTLIDQMFTDTNRNVIELTYDRAIETPDSSTTALPGFSVSADGGANFARTGFSVAIVASNKIRVTKDATSWPMADTRVDYLRGVPFTSDSGNTAEYVGAESGINAGYLQKVIVDTGAFDSGRGMPAAPVMGTGAPVREYSEPATPTLTATRRMGMGLRQSRLGRGLRG